jgi:aspartyl-tRNA(Asn)/glutamyl-tRNA(Gln) amidotransferase subunit A
VATGSDIGGSIRTPASVNGVVGYLPPAGRVPVAGVWGRDEWSRVGPLARTVADCALVLDVVAGPHPRDHMSLPPLPPVGVPGHDVRGLRVAWSPDLGDWPVTDEVRAAVGGVADALAAAGARVETVDLTIERDLVRKASNCHNAGLFAASLELEVAGHEDDLTPYTRAWLAELAGDRSPTSFFEGRMADAEICARVDASLDDHDVLLTPAMCFPAFEAGVDHTQVPFVLDGTERDVWHDLHLTEAFNPVSRCPVLTVPAGRSADGVPIGVQVVGRRLDERTPFTVGAAIERERPWPTVAEPVPS